MLALHPRLVVAADDADAAGADGGRACYCAAVTCVSLLLFVVLAATVSVARAGAITGGVLLLLLLCGWLAPGRQHQQQQPVARRRCAACGLSDAAIEALPAFAYQPPPPAAAAAKDAGSGGRSEKKPPRGSSSVVLCAVCLEDVQAGEMVRQLLPACGHLFHVDCVDAWLRAHRTCPLCRRDISARNHVVAAKVSDDDGLPPV
ncbi:hypothetical protein PR202_gb27601 [Eleusine coracana subsp. coracana]|uniref:RING-type E3 ubiquitin transferase n=1 Tax=Eleusine coracana subsp. coracana TaxID=191504 RepID=A0AAV5FV68_ELECO|nr:hypothetical protein QOZ80_6AG0541900 [Eleusine coracana subsp. coracana]GJN38547.1 hypothetical protein PR202_gb27601 [Eleusine coracana subsp. coracana]